MSQIPVVDLGGVLLVSIQQELLDGAITGLQQELAQRVIDTQACGILIDVSVVEVIDSFLARTLHEIAAITALLAGRTVVVGMRPAVAITLVELGLTLPGLSTALSVGDGLAMLRGQDGPR